MRLGLVGAGTDARLQADCYERLPDVTLAGVAGGDADPELATDYSDVEALLAEERLDAVDVCDHRVRQRDVVDQCLDAGVAVVCRAPLGDDLDEAIAIRDAAERSDTPVLVDGVHRFAQENRDAKARIDEGDLGTPTTVRTTRRLPFADSSDDGPSGASDALLRRALYPDVARVRWLFGDVERVFVRTAGAASSADHAHAVVVARFASGAIGHLNVYAGDRYDRVEVGFEYSGTEGRITYDNSEFATIEVQGVDAIRTGVGRRFRRARPSQDVYERHAEHLVACLRGEDDPVETVADSVETFRTVLAAVTSARRGAPVAVSEVAL